MAKKKIIHIVPTFELGGVQTGILYSLEELNSVFDYRVLVISRVDLEWVKTLPPHLRDRIIQTNASSVISGSFKAFGMLRKIKPDFLISSLWKSVILSITYKLIYPKVYLFGFFHNAFTYHFYGDFFLKLMSMVQNSALADSNETKMFLAKTYNVRNVAVIPYNFTFTKNKFKKKNFDPAHIRMAYFGRLTQIKGIERSIEFCRLCKMEGINFTFDLYGDGTIEGFAKNTYPEKIKDRGLENEVSLKEILPLNRVLEKMHQYDFLLQLSNMEGMALSVVEAMNCGLVPLVTPVGEISKYSRDGVNAIWLDPEFDSNLPLLVNKLKKVVADPALYESLSSSAENTFTTYKKYSEAMIEAINSRLPG